MGAGQSTPISTVSREALLRSTQPMRDVADAALKVMLERITPRDLLNLASPTECSKYVTVIGSAFDHFFRSIDVVPLLKGKPPQTIYFQKADILTGRQSTGSKYVDEQYKAYREQICKLLGYFFTRFFQIFAALVLTIFDDAMIGVGGVGGILPTMGQLPKFGPVFGSAAASAAAYQQLGGARFEQVFRTIANIDRFEEITLFTRERSSDFHRIRGAGLYGGGIYLNWEGSQASFTYATSGYERVTVIATITSSDKYFTVRPKNVRKQDSQYIIPGNISITFREDSDGVYRLVSSNAPSYGQQYRKRLDTVIADMLTEYIEKSASTIGSEAYLARIHAHDYRDAATIARDRQAGVGYGTEAGTTSDRIPEHLEPLYVALQKQNRPIGHCVARSLQLLNLDALAPGGRAAYTQMCNVKFLEGKKSSIVEPGKALDSSIGMRALDTLFKVYENGAVRLTDATRTEYITFLKAMSAIYKGGDGITEDSFKRIINQADVQLCGRLKQTEQILMLEGPEVEAAKAGVIALWKRQYEHTVAVDQLLAQMFAVGPQRMLHINPTIMQNGLPALEEIAGRARQLLANYYANCESIYQQSAQTIMRMKEGVAVAAAQQAAAQQQQRAPPPLMPAYLPKGPTQEEITKKTARLKELRQKRQGVGLTLNESKEFEQLAQFLRANQAALQLGRPGAQKAGKPSLTAGVVPPLSQTRRVNRRVPA